MTRLAAIPPHLLGKPTYEPNEERVAVVAELQGLRAKLSLCSGRMAVTQESIEREIGHIEVIVGKLKELAGRL